MIAFEGDRFCGVSEVKSASTCGARQVVVNETNADCALADSRRDALDRVASYVADGEHSGHR
jgi:hypothetical protein